jgi:hypothetical protein
VKLLDAATVETRGRGEPWERGWDADPRGCGGISVWLSQCDPAVTADVIGTQAAEDAADDCAYRVVPFGFIAEMRRNVRMARDDDENWLADALKASAEIPVARGLLVRQDQGAALGETWIGSPRAFEIAAPALTDANAVAAAVADARSEFFNRTIGLQPILHINPGNAIALKKAGVVELDPVNGEDRTAWGDQVVISEGYSDIPDLTAVPMAFFTGPIDVTLSDVNKEDVIRAVRMNRMIYQTSMIAAIDTLPCAIVRIGAAPAPVAP